jgi:hypothetical protein
MDRALTDPLDYCSSTCHCGAASPWRSGGWFQNREEATFRARMERRSGEEPCRGEAGAR